MNTSPVINDYIIGLQADFGEDSDSVSFNTLLTECFVILIDLLEEQGIIITCSLEEILENYYDARYLIDLYTKFNTTYLEAHLKDDSDLFNYISTAFDNISSGEALVTILDAYQKLYTNDTNRMYSVLWDKISNTEAYYTVISSILTEVSIDDTQTTISATSLDYIFKLRNYKMWLGRVIVHLVSLPKYNDDIDLDTGMDYISTFRTEFTKVDRVNILSDPVIYETNKELILKIRKDIAYESKFYYKSHITDVSLLQLIGYIAAKVSDTELFGTEMDMSDLHDLVDIDLDILLADIMSVPNY
jgi:hypothetical protein